MPVTERPGPHDAVAAVLSWISQRSLMRTPDVIDSPGHKVSKVSLYCPLGPSLGAVVTHCGGDT